MTVTEKIGDQYKKWKSGNIYLINAGTGKGKSYFVTNQLYEYAEENNKKILLMCNRTLLKAQFDEAIKEKNIDILTYQKLEYHDRQHNLQYELKENIDLILNKYDYIVLDEAHYMYTDSSFNKYTDVIQNALNECKAIIVMLSATPHLIKQDYKDKIKKEYIIKSDYSYIDDVIYYESKDTIDQLLIRIPDGEKAIVFSNNKQRLKMLYEKYHHCSYYIDSDKKYSNKRTKKLSEPVRQIVENEKFDKKFLFCTKVLDNGVNIKDKSLKHIFIEIDDLVEFIQCLGRKRVCDEYDTMTLYFYNYTSYIERAKYQDLKRIYQVYLDYVNYSTEKFNEKYKREELPYFLQHDYGVIKPALTYFLDRFNYIEKICNKEIYYQNEIRTILKMPRKKIKKIHAVTPNEVLKEYLSDRKGKKLFLQEKEELINIFNIRKDDKLINHIEQLNTYLSVNSIPFHIVSGRESTDTVNRNMRYWMIE